MALRQLLRRRLIRRVNYREIVMRVDVIGIGRDRFQHLFLGRFLPAFLARGDPEIIMRDEALRVDRQRLGQFGDRVIVLRLPVINDPERPCAKIHLSARG